MPDTLHAELRSITSLKLVQCNLNAANAATLGAALAANTTLVALDLSYNPLGPDGVYDIMRGLRGSLTETGKHLFPSPRVATAPGSAAEASRALSRPGLHVSDDESEGSPRAPAGPRPQDTQQQDDQSERESAASRMGSRAHVARISTAEEARRKKDVQEARKQAVYTGSLLELRLAGVGVAVQRKHLQSIDTVQTDFVESTVGTKAIGGYLLDPHCGLRVLDVSKNQLSAAAMAPLAAALGRNTVLRELHVSQCKLGPDSVALLAAVALRKVVRQFPGAADFVDSYGEHADPMSYYPAPDTHAWQPPRTAELSRPPTTVNAVGSALLDDLPSRPQTSATVRYSARQQGSERPVVLPPLGSTEPLPQPGTAARPATAFTYGSLVTMKTNDTWNPRNPMLKHNGLLPVNLVMLDVRGCSIGDAGAARVASYLDHNSNLQRLILRSNSISEVGFRDVARGLRGSSLVQLDISSNPLHVEGAFMLANALESNTWRVREVDASQCLFTDDGTDPRGVLAIAAALHLNTTLRGLRLAGNCLVSQKLSWMKQHTRECVLIALSEAMVANCSLRLLDVRGNWAGVPSREAFRRMLTHAGGAVTHAAAVVEVLSTWIKSMFKQRSGTMADLVDAEEQWRREHRKSISRGYGDPFALTHARTHPASHAYRRLQAEASPSSWLRSAQQQQQQQQQQHSAGTLPVQATGWDALAGLINEHNEGTSMLDAACLHPSIAGQALDIDRMKSLLGAAVPGAVKDEAAAVKVMQAAGIVHGKGLGVDVQRLQVDAQDSEWQLEADGYVKVARPDGKEFMVPYTSTAPGPRFLRSRGTVGSPIPGMRRSELASAGMASMGSVGTQFGEESPLLPGSGRFIDSAGLRSRLMSPWVAPYSPPVQVRGGSRRSSAGWAIADEVALEQSRDRWSRLLVSRGIVPAKDIARLRVNLASAGTVIADQLAQGGVGPASPPHGGPRAVVSPGNWSEAPSVSTMGLRAKPRGSSSQPADDSVSVLSASSNVFETGFGEQPVSAAEALKIALSGGAFSESQAEEEAAVTQWLHDRRSGTAGSETSRTRAAVAVPKLDVMALKKAPVSGAPPKRRAPQLDEPASPPDSSRSDWSTGGLWTPRGVLQEHGMLPTADPGGLPQAVRTALNKAMSPSRPGTSLALVTPPAPSTADEASARPSTAQTTASEALRRVPYAQAPGVYTVTRAGKYGVHGNKERLPTLRTMQIAAAKAREQSDYRPVNYSIIRKEWDERPPYHPVSSLAWVRPRLVRAVLEYLSEPREVLL